MEIINQFHLRQDLGRAKPATTKTVTAAEHFRQFHDYVHTDVWTEDGWLVTAVQRDGVTHHLRRGSEGARAMLEPKTVLHYNPPVARRPARWFPE